MSVYGGLLAFTRCVKVDLGSRGRCLEEWKIGFFWEICLVFPFSALLGSTVDAYGCQFTEAFGFSRTREGGPRIPRSILPCPGSSRKISPIFIVKMDTLLRLILVLLAVCIHVHASIYDRFWKNFPYFPDEFGLGS